MNRPLNVPQGAAVLVRKRLSEVTKQSERTFLLGTVLLLTAGSAALGYVLAQYFAVDIVTSLVFFPEDCYGNWGTNVGRHCFSDYAMVVGAGTRPNPWQPYPMFPPHAPLRIPYPAAGLLPQLLFGLPAKLLGVPFLGLIGYQVALTIAVVSPAVWAARGTRGLEQVVVFVALSAAAIPAWVVIDRGNSVGFVVPVALVFLVALCRRRWGLVTLMVVLAALVKPQFAVLAIVLFAARQWRWGGIAVGGIAISNFAAYLLWPQDFPQTIAQSIHNLFATSGLYLTDLRNVSFGRALLLIPDYVHLFQAGKMSDDFLAGPRSLFGYAILILVVISVLALGRRISPVMAGIVLLATATFFPPLSMFYYLVFVLPVAALVVRDPDGRPGAGIFEELVTQGQRRRAVGICVTVAVALTIAQIALPGPIDHTDIRGQMGTRGVVGTTVFLAPLLWLIACAVILVSYARRPVSLAGVEEGPDREGPPDTAANASPNAPELLPESPQGSA
ncbi:hypothetical protein A9X05_07005 [Mycobacterium sp. E3298]|uniref:glycosyltransferase family 87 protein n=1 Tax=Mycobacterium sp. E3298 TaxID=1856865 RepID=UPI0008023083|nr:glycosyltransferase family 87 protein [Mycobacterium sp. E3298]OBG95562.1 hypothetical protein A9X05_07005 [Mycobacterium sp. E3298]